MSPARRSPPHVCYSKANGDVNVRRKNLDGMRPRRLGLPGRFCLRAGTTGWQPALQSPLVTPGYAL